MRLAICGPVDVPALTPWLDDLDQYPERLHGLTSSSITQLVLGLLERGHELVVVTLDPQIERPLHLTGAQLSVRIGPYRPRHRARDAFAAERRVISEALHSEMPDIVHAQWTYEYALGAIPGAAPTLVTVHDWAPRILRYQPTPYRAVRLLMNLVALAGATAMTGPSPYIAERVHRLTGRLVKVVPNGIADEVFRPRNEPPSLRRPEVIAVNNGYSGFKNIGSLLRAFALVRAEIPGSRLRLVGTDHEPAGAAQQWAAEHELLDEVIFHGPVTQDELYPLLRAADLFVHPSREESFGLVLAEAMSQGLPVVGGRRSGAVPWVLGAGEAGSLVDVESPSDIAAGILALLRNEEEWWRLSQAGYHRASELFRTSKVLDGYVDAYERVQQAGKRRSAAGWLL
jgi:L-malate glycosyltransferase